MFEEVNNLITLDHPNIMKLYELFQDNKNYYLVTEYIVFLIWRYLSGGELFEKIRTMTHFSERIAADFMKQLLSAVYYFHDKRIVHRYDLLWINFL